MPFFQMPTARTNEQNCRLVDQSVPLAGLRVSKRNRPSYRVAKIQLAFNEVLPCWGCGVLEVRHENLGATVQRIDDHLAVNRSGNLHAAIKQIFRHRCDRPFRLANLTCFRKKVRALSRVQSFQTVFASFQQLLTTRSKPVLQLCKESDGLRRKYFYVPRIDRLRQYK